MIGTPELMALGKLFSSDGEQWGDLKTTEP